MADGLRKGGGRRNAVELGFDSGRELSALELRKMPRWIMASDVGCELLLVMREVCRLKS